MSSRRRRLHVLAAVLGIFVVLLATATVLFRLSDPSQSNGSSPDTQGGSVPTTATDPAEEPSPDETGARAAALAYVAAPQTWLYMTDEEVREAVSRLAVPGAVDRLADTLVGEVSSARAELARSTGPVWWIVHPLAWKVDRFTPTEATVSIWTFSFLSAADVAVPQTEWTTTTFDLEWYEGSWRVVSFRDTPGPTPAVGASDQPWEPEPLDDALEGFTRLTWGDS